MLSQLKTSTLIIISCILCTSILSSCSKTGLLSKGEELNKELEGEWELEEYLLNGNDASVLLPDTYLVFAPSVNEALEGKLITTPKDGQSTVQEYALSQDGKTITIEGSASDIELEGDLLTIEGSVLEDGTSIEVILVLDKQ